MTLCRKEKQWCGLALDLQSKRVQGSNPGFATSISEILYLLLPSPNASERLLKQCKIFKTQPIVSEIGRLHAYGQAIVS